MQTSPHIAGFPLPNDQQCGEPASSVTRPLSQQWITEEQISETRRVWSKAYGRVITEDEAIEIMVNVRKLAEVLLRAEQEKASHERSDLGAGVIPRAT